MARELKTIICDQLKQRLGDLDSCVLVDYAGLNAEQDLDLRTSLRQVDVQLFVVQNRLTRRVLAESGAPEDFQALFRGPTAVLAGEGGALSASKQIVEWLKKNKDGVKIKGGLFEGETLGVAAVEQLARIPDKDTLRSQVLSSMMSPATFLVSAVQGILSHFAGATQARREDLEESGGGS